MTVGRDRIVEAEKAEKADARNEWLAMNQQTASGVLAGLSGGEVPVIWRHPVVLLDSR